jgi:beta-lactamase regulating signal transducer with metallopeptidase domain
MSVLIAIALKSLLIGGVTLGLLHLMRRRSAAERSWVAHIGLLALMIMAFAPLILPNWNVEAPAVLGQAELTPIAKPAIIDADAAPRVTIEASAVAIARSTASARDKVPVHSKQPHAQPITRPLDPIAVATAAYAVPAALLLFVTFLALARLVALQARAEVLVDGHWLSALARAQRRMGFKHGTALLTSNELASPISWGLIRPVILLNSRAVEATDEAEAIISHELAHVARLDWIKLLLARVATALFWFNPLVWLLAREAHQLREEAADDTVLAADIAETDYAQLLVGVARHECPGLLLGAHGVAPSKSSLARRVARVLDVKSARGPVARGFALGVFTGAVLVAAPLAALTLTPAAPKAAPSAAKFAAAEPHVRGALRAEAEAVHADLPHIIAQGVSTSVSTAMAAVSTASQAQPVPNGTDDARRIARDAARATRDAEREAARDAERQARDEARQARDATREAGRADRLDARIEVRTIGVTPEYVDAMRAAAPRLENLGFSDFAGMRVVGVTPEFARSLGSAGFPSMSAHELMEARAVGLSAAYVTAMRSAGVEGDLDDFVQLRAVGVSPSLATRARASGMRHLDADTLVEMRVIGPGHAMAPHVPRIYVKINRKSDPKSDAGNRDANPDPDQTSDPDG